MPQFENKENKVLLMGPPNVGKSVIFNHLTGLDSAIANYSGTTVDYKEGRITYRDDDIYLIDVPGTYTLDSSNEAEQVAVDMLNKGASLLVIVLDANNIESSIYLLLQILEMGIPAIAVLNRIDLLEEKGYSFAAEAFAEELKIDIIETVAVKEFGLAELKNKISEKIQIENQKKLPKKIKASWKNAERLSAKYLKQKSKKEKNKREELGDKLSSPWPGIPLALLILAVIFAIVVGIGMGLRQYVLLPFFRGLVFPQIYRLVAMFTTEGIIRNILVGEYGFLIKGLEWPFALVLPYVLSFYTALSLLEDSGYMPRLAVLLDGLFNKIGLTGGNIIPLLLGYGCAIPGIAATRALATRKERITVAALISLAVPCISQTGALISLLAEESILVMFLVFLVSFLAIIGAAIIMDKSIEGKNEPLVLEIPPLLIPEPKMILRKVWLRLKMYISDGALMMIYAIAAAALLYELGILEQIGRLFQPIIEHWLLMPSEASVPLILGVVRRELAVLPLLEMGLNSVQLFVGAVVALFYVPCIAVLAMLAREFSFIFATKIFLFTIGFSFFIGGIFARLGFLFI